MLGIEGSDGVVVWGCIFIVSAFVGFIVMAHCLAVLFDEGYRYYEKYVQKKIKEDENLPAMGVDFDETYLRMHWLFDGEYDEDDKRK